MNEPEHTSQETVFFVYDGECPLCQLGARHIRIRKAAGKLELVDARTQGGYPVMEEIKARGLNIDKGMVVKTGDNVYHGADALHVLALLGTDSDWINRLNARLFRSRLLAKLSYPLMRACRRLALMAKGVPPL